LVWLGTSLLDRQLAVLVHAYYLVLLVAASWFSVRGTALIAVVLGPLGGPLAPAGFIPETHAWYAWVLRTVFFVLVGVIAAAGVKELRLRQARLEGLYSGLLRLYSSTLRGMALALEMKDEETSAHCERVGVNARTMGRALGVPPDESDMFYWAGYLHDLGKLATPSNILAKPGKLTDEEYQIVQQHTVLGEQLLLAISEKFATFAKGVRHHHEHWDGSGYPDGLEAKAIPLLGRILGVVDVFEALTSDRPYRKAWSEEDARRELEAGAGSHFDPAIVQVFLSLLDGDRIVVEGRHGSYPGRGEPPLFDPQVAERALASAVVGTRAARTMTAE
jgi:HD-GYP domain-containing protein (c-di-GMP phosphodiesterase class II)